MSRSTPHWGSSHWSHDLDLGYCCMHPIPVCELDDWRIHSETTCSFFHLDEGSWFQHNKQTAVSCCNEYGNRIKKVFYCSRKREIVYWNVEIVDKELKLKNIERQWREQRHHIKVFRNRRIKWNCCKLSRGMSDMYTVNSTEISVCTTQQEHLPVLLIPYILRQPGERKKQKQTQ